MSFPDHTVLDGLYYVQVLVKVDTIETCHFMKSI
jgi:hypothetical protein